MFNAVIFLAGPSRSDATEMKQSWHTWHPKEVLDSANSDLHVYIADAGLESFLPWYDSLSKERKKSIKNVVWCGDGDSLGKHGAELLASSASRFAGLWREHVYSGEKDFSDCAAITSLIEYDLRHMGTAIPLAWIEVRGALGGRMDHEIANLFEFFASLQRMPCVGAYVIGPNNVLTTLPVRGTLKKGDTFSVSSMQAASMVKVKISGARYSGEIQLRQPSHGLSNVAQESEIEIVPENHSAPILLMHVE